MNSKFVRHAIAVLLLLTGALLSSCESSSGVGFSVGLPTNYGSMELGLQTTQWAGGPFW
jgi:predicted small secreted protein